MIRQGSLFGRYSAKAQKGSEFFRIAPLVQLLLKLVTQ